MTICPVCDRPSATDDDLEAVPEARLTRDRDEWEANAAEGHRRLVAAEARIDEREADDAEAHRLLVKQLRQTAGLDQ